MTINKLIIGVLLLFPLYVLGQTGPAGVGSSTTNVLWLRSHDIGQANNTNISTWADQSGNSNSITQPTSTYQHLPAVVYNKPTEYISCGAFCNR